MGLPWGWIALLIFITMIGTVFASTSGNHLRVTIDRNNGTLIIATPQGQFRFDSASLARAEFTAQNFGENPNPYRLELIMKNGRRVSATTALDGGSYGFDGHHRANLVAAINAALGQRAD